MFGKILIANRGEIACRVIATCRRLGIRTVAVYSEADASARHVRLADEAYGIGPAASSASYLRAERILEVARQSGAQAVHPGYGFLSENAGFAEACAAAGVVFIGPPALAIRAMGSKSAAKALMERADVPLVPGYHGEVQTPERLRAEADRIGYPVLIKASAGGGGKGMRVVERAQDFAEALASCQREARASFGDDRVLIEKFLERPRHIEIQVFGDAYGEVIHLHERDCSAQRRHQKVVEEAPAPDMDAHRRAAMGQAACDAARAVGYVGAGTVEFIVASDSQFYFMEMNTRLQVEHPVTELITGLDLVEWQLRIADGERLPCSQKDVPLHGHAIEVRVYAEEPEKDFLPSVGRLIHFVPPLASAHVRIDSGVEQGDEITPHYDPMIAKLIVHDATRERARQRLLQALSEFRIVGVGNNLGFLSRLVDSTAFAAGRVDTGLIARESAALLRGADALPPQALHAAALWTVLIEARALQARAQASEDPHSPWSQGDGFRLNGTHQRRLTYRCAEQQHEVVLSYESGAWSLDGVPVRVIAQGEDGRIQYRTGDHTLACQVVAQGDHLHVFSAGQRYVLTRVDALQHAGEDAPTDAGVVAPLPGRIVALLGEVGALVDRGAPLLMMEAMKMEHTLRAPSQGKVRAFLCRAGDLVQGGAALFEFEASP